MPAWGFGSSRTAESSLVFNSGGTSWQLVWSGAVSSYDDWSLKLMTNDIARLVRWEVMSVSRQTRAMATLDQKGMMNAGMDPRLNMTQLSKQAATLCQSGRMNVAEMRDGSGNVLLTLTHQIDASDEILDYTFTLIAIQPEPTLYSAPPSPAFHSYSDSTNLVAQLRADNERKDREIQKLSAELRIAKEEAAQNAILLKQSESRVTEMGQALMLLKQAKEGDSVTMMKQQQKWQQQMDEHGFMEITVKQMTQDMNQMRHQLELSENERSHLMSEVMRLTNDLGDEVARREVFQKDLEDLAIEVLKHGIKGWDSVFKGWAKNNERDEKGNPLFVRKMDDFRRTGSILDQLQAQYLYRNRSRVRADAEYTWKGPAGETRRGNALYFCAGFPCLFPVFEWLMKDGSIDPNERTKDKWKSTPLMIASIRGNIAAAEMLLRDVTVSRNATNAVNATSLMHAAAHNHPSLVCLLLEYGCDSTMKDSKYNHTALDIAKKNGHTEVVSILETVKQMSKK